MLALIEPIAAIRTHVGKTTNPPAVMTKYGKNTRQSGGVCTVYMVTVQKNSHTTAYNNALI